MNCTGRDDGLGIRVLHLADVHLGMENLGRVDAQTGLHSRLLDFLHSLDQAVRFALEQEIDLVVFAGDAYKTRDPSPTQQREFARRIKQLSDAGIPVVLLVGNHDLPNADSKAHSLEIFRTLAVPQVQVVRRPQVFRLMTRRGEVQVAALPYLSRSMLLAKDDYKNLGLEELNLKIAETLSILVEGLARRLDPQLPSILTAHLSVANAVLGSEKSIMIGNDPVVPLSCLARPEFDYVALGHIHRHQVLSLAPPTVYAGSLDRIDFGEEREEKGFVVVDLAKGQTKFRFQPVQTRPLVTVNVDVDPQQPTESVLAALEQVKLAGAIVRLNLRLEQAVLPLLRQAEINRVLQERAFWVAGINREVTLPRGVVRQPEMTENLDPLTALQKYIHGREELRSQSETLMNLARQLVAELREEEMSGQ